MTWWFTQWHRWDQRLQWFERSFLLAGILMILLGGTLDIAFRLVLGWGFGFIDILARQLTIWIGLWGATLATRMDEHIRIDALGKLFSTRTQRGLKLFVSLCSFFFNLLFFVYTCAFVRFAYHDSAQVSHLGKVQVESWKLLLGFPVAFAVMTSRTALHVFEHIYALRGRPFAWSVFEEFLAEGENAQRQMSAQQRANLQEHTKETYS
ncbi:MAG: TRAP transporter small permease [Myxococcota bacterium]